MIAVVKNIPIVYLHAYENYLYEDVSGISMSLNQCKNIFIMNLLNIWMRIKLNISIHIECDYAFKTASK